jgi:hypothetical protein
MVFHGDYEVEFEIYETAEDDERDKFLGYMVGISAGDAEARWLETHAPVREKRRLIVRRVALGKK